MKRRRATTAGAAAAVCLLAATGIAGAAIGVGSKDFKVPSNEIRERTAECEKGRALSGGFVAPLPGGNKPAMLPLDSTLDGDSGWRLRARNSGKSGKATTYVYCKRGATALGTASAVNLIAADEVGSIAAECPVGQEAVAGGFETPDAVTHLLASKRTAERTWEVTFFNNSGESQSYTAFAYCDASSPGLATRSKAITTDGSQERFGQSVTAKCKRSQNLRSGGFEIERDLHGPRRAARPGFRSRLKTQRRPRLANHCLRDRGLSGADGVRLLRLTLPGARSCLPTP